MNKIIIEEIIVGETRIDYKCSIEGEWKKLFSDIPFWVEYNSAIYKTPKSIAVIPILGTLLPLAWLYDGRIEVDEIDQDFYECIPKIKQEYQKMYSEINLSGEIVVRNVLNNKMSGVEKSACLFSGGVDAVQTLITHMSEKPILLSIWGADIAYDNQKGWKLIEKNTKTVAKENGLEYCIIHSSFRKFVIEDKVHKDTMKWTGYGWWYGFHHSLGMLCLMAPLVGTKMIKKIYIASSNTAEDTSACASDPKIDNKVTYAGAHIEHDGFEFNRQQKVCRIARYIKENNKSIKVHVCWQDASGENCCRCEKCARTMLEFYAEGIDPQEVGFSYTLKDIKKMSYDLKYGPILLTDYNCYYLDSQKILRKNYTLNQVIPCLRWFYNCDINRISEAGFRGKTLFRKIIRLVERKQFE